MKALSSYFLVALMMMISMSSIAQMPIYEWAKAMGGTGNDNGYSVVVDAAGNVYTTGSFNGTVDFDPGAGVYNLTSIGSHSYDGDIFISKLDASGNFVWAKQMGGSGSEVGIDIALDASGNIYTTGVFESTVDFDPGAGIFNLFAGGIQNTFISKLDASGNFVWAKSFVGNSGGRGISIELDGFGNVYTTGNFSQTTDFDPGPGVFNLLTVSSIPNSFVSKLDANGNFVWAKKLGAGATTAGGASIALDASGNVYSTGTFKGTGDFDPGAGIINLTSATTSFTDIFISKLDPSGNFVWAKRIGGTQADVSNAIAIDASSNVYITGWFQDMVDFDPNAGTVYISSVPINRTDIFITKLDASGNFIWANRIGGAQSDQSYSIALDATANIYTTGTFQSTVDFDPGPGIYNISGEGIYVSKLNTDGNFVWAVKLTSYADIPSINLDAAENVYTTGGFTSSFDADPGPGTDFLINQGSYDIFVHKMRQYPSVPPTITSVIPASGYNGSTITITGTNFNRPGSTNENFSSATGVMVGGVNVSSFTIVNPYTITAIVGAGNAGAVTVTTVAGTFSSATNFTNLGYKTIYDGNWDLDVIWLGGIAPPAGSSATVDNNVTLNSNVTVNSGNSIIVNGQIQCGTYTISGSGSFALIAGASFWTGNASGVNGSIGTASYTLSQDANYIFNGTSSQNTSGMPSTIRSLTINNTGVTGNNKVTLWQNPLTITNATYSIIFYAGLLSNGGGIFMPMNGEVISVGGDFDPQYPGSLYCGNGGTVTMSGYSPINFGTIAVYNNTSLSFNGTCNIISKLDLQSGAGVVTGVAPTYLANSQLRYSNGTTYTRGKEWTSMSGPGYPAQVYVGTNLMINNGIPSALIGCSDMMTIAGTLNMTGMTSPLTVSWLNYGGAAIRSIILSDQPGGDLKFNGPFWSMNLTNFTPNGRKVILFGSSDQTIQGNATALLFDNLVIDKTGGTVTLNNDVTVNQELALTNGVITTGANKMILKNTGYITGSGSSNYINGKLQKVVIAGSSSVTFPIGDASIYRPVTVDFNQVPGGDLLAFVSQTAGDHPNIGASTLDPNRSVNRYWTLTDVNNSFTSGTYDAIFEFASVDKDVLLNPSNTRIGKYSAGAWAYPTTLAVDALHTKAIAVNGFSDFAIAEMGAPVVICSVSGSGTTTPVSCFGNSNGTATIVLTGEGSGSTGTYTVDGGSMVAYATNPFLVTGLAAGNHSIVATVTGGGCVSSNILVNVGTPATFTTTYVKTNLSSCGVSPDGTITVTPTGGTGPYNYAWSGITGSGNPATTVYANPGNVSAVTGLNYGYYNVTITDVGGCGSVTLSNIHVELAYAVYVTNSGGISSSCGNTGSILLYGNAGVLPYSYSLNGITYQTSNSFTGLAAATYTGYVKDAGGCVSTKPGIVIGSSTPVTVSPFARSASSCSPDGSIEIYRSGGIPPYTYSLDNMSYQSVNTFQNLAAGPYTAYVKDSKGCIGSQTVTVGQGVGLTVTAQKTNSSTCINNGSIQVNTSGGIAPYTYSINGVVYQPGSSFSGLGVGNYTVTVKDFKGCLGSMNVAINLNTINVTAYAVSASSCNLGVVGGDGSIQLFRTGGEGPYTYSLDGNIYQSSTIFLGLAPGIYNGYVKDSKTCIGVLNGILVGPNCPPTFTKISTINKSMNTKPALIPGNTGLEMQVYPNPSATEFTVTITDNNNDRVSFTVTDLLGRKMVQQKEGIGKQFKFGKELTAGIYILEIIRGNEKKSIKLIRE